MRQSIEKAICPHCNFKHEQHVGYKYYYVKQLKDTFTVCVCPSCNKEFWHNGKRSAEIMDDDEAVLQENNVRH